MPLKLNSRSQVILNLSLRFQNDPWIAKELLKACRPHFKQARSARMLAYCLLHRLKQSENVGPELLYSAAAALTEDEDYLEDIRAAIIRIDYERVTLQVSRFLSLCAFSSISRPPATESCPEQMISEFIIRESVRGNFIAQDQYTGLLFKARKATQ